jgi:hypothetical protein
MNALCPLARAFVDQTVQSAALHHKHRAQIWAKLQQRVLAESSAESPSRWPVARAPKPSIGWAGFLVASCAMFAIVLATAHRLELASEKGLPTTCPAAPALSPVVSLAPTTAAGACAQAMPPATTLATKQAPVRTSRPKQQPSLADARGTAKPERLRSNPIPPNQVATLLPQPDLKEVVAQRSKGMASRRPRGIGADDEGDWAPAYDGLQLSVTGGWLQVAPQMVGGISPLAESRFEPSLPLKLTRPQLRLTAALLE